MGFERIACLPLGVISLAGQPDGICLPRVRSIVTWALFQFGLSVEHLQSGNGPEWGQHNLIVVPERALSSVTGGRDKRPYVDFSQTIQP